MIAQRVRRREDRRLITGHGQYVDDLGLPGLRHITFVRSDLAHARLVSVDTAEAVALDGVEAYTAADVDLGRMAIVFAVPVDERVTRPYLADATVRYVGEIIATVVSSTREQGVDAAELVTVGFEPLAVVTDPRSENMVGMGHGRGQIVEFELGGDGDGTIRALRTRMIQEVGAYPWIGTVLPIERVTVIKGDTARVPRGAGTGSSKSTEIGGVAARGAAEQVAQNARRVAAELLEADPRDMLFDCERGQFHVNGAPEPSLDWPGLAGALGATGRPGELTAYSDFAAPKPTYPFGAHIAVVEVDSLTPINSLGAKGIGESGTIGSTPAVHNAVIDAVSHLGVRHIDMPVHGERVWRAITEAIASSSPS